VSKFWDDRVTRYTDICRKRGISQTDKMAVGRPTRPDEIRHEAFSNGDHACVNEMKQANGRLYLPNIRRRARPMAVR